MTAKKSLQKFTETENRVIKLFEQKKIVPEDYKDFDKNEKKQFDVELQKRMNTLQGSEKERFLEQVDAIMTEIQKTNFGSRTILILCGLFQY